MLTAAEMANSKARVQILSDRKTWESFDAYFAADWQRKELRLRLANSGVDLPWVGEWAIWSFHRLGKEEASWKRQRGKDFIDAQRRIIAACDQVAKTYLMYTSLPEDAPEIAAVNAAFTKFLNDNNDVRELSVALLKRAEESSIFKPGRLGKNWNGMYLLLLKYYIANKTGWGEIQVLTAVTNLVGAALKTLQNRIPDNLREILRKAIQHFENNPRNATIIDRVKKLAVNHEYLLVNFPKVRPSTQ
jgi:hypothetical protein